MLIIGIDPGINCTGWGVVAKEASKIVHIASGEIKTKRTDQTEHKLYHLHNELSAILQQYNPDELAIEETFVNRNPSTSLILGQARGALILSARIYGIEITSYAPNLVKKTITGSGHADKIQMQKMINFLFPKISFNSADAADALAIAFCHAQHIKNYK